MVPVFTASAASAYVAWNPAFYFAYSSYIWANTKPEFQATAYDTKYRKGPLIWGIIHEVPYLWNYIWKLPVWPSLRATRRAMVICETTTTTTSYLGYQPTHQRVVLHNLTQVLTYCCPVKFFKVIWNYTDKFRLGICCRPKFFTVAPGWVLAYRARIFNFSLKSTSTR